MTGLGKIVRALVGVLVIVVLLVTVNGWYREYKAAEKVAQLKSAEASGSVDSTLVVPVAGGKKVKVLVDGLVLRSVATTSGKTVRKLKKSEQLILVGTTDTGWLQLRDAANGQIGYVANDTAKLQVQK